MRLLTTILIILLLISCKKNEINDGSEPTYNFKNYFQIHGESYVTDDNGNTTYVQDIKYELTHGIISRSYDLDTKKYYFGILLLSSNITIIDKKNGTELGYSATEAMNGIFINGLMSDSPSIKEGINTFQLNGQFSIKSAAGANKASIFNYNMDGRDWPIKSGTATVLKNGDKYEITLDAIEGIADRKFTAYFSGDLTIRNINSTMLSLSDHGDYINYYYINYSWRRLELNECYTSDYHHTGAITGYSHSITLKSYSKKNKSISGDYYSNPSNYEKIDAIHLNTRGVGNANGREIVRLKNGRYMIGSDYLYSECKVYTKDNLNELVIYKWIESGYFDVSVNDSIIEIDLVGNTEMSGKYNVLAHYEGKYEKFDNN